MATLVPSYKLDPAIEAAQKEQDSLEKQLSSSPTAYGTSSPSSSDLKADVALTAVKDRIAKLQSQKQSEAWYGPSNAPGGDTTTAGAQNEGFLNTAINVLAAPARGVTGAVESILGKSNGKGILENATSNILTDHQTYGDILQEFGAPKWVSAPLGFALDVVGDPINWLTAGTTALIPRIGEGIVKGAETEGLMGALKGAESAATSSLGGRALSVAKRIPFVKDTGLFKNLAEGVAQKGEQYAAITGIDQLNLAGKGLLPFIDSRPGGFTLGQGFEDMIRKIPGGDTVIDRMKYSTGDYAKQAQILDSTFKVLSKEGLNSSVPADLNKVLEMANNPLNKTFTVEKVGTHYEQLKNILSDAVSDTENVLKTGTNDSFLMADGASDLEARMAQEAILDKKIKDSVQYFTKLNSQKTGMEFYDKLAASAEGNISKFKIGNAEVGKKLLQVSDVANNVFKLGKVILNPASYVNNSISNVFFAAMHGLDPVDTFITGEANIKNVWQFLSGKDGVNGANFILKSFLDDTTDWSKFVSANPSKFTSAYGWNPSMVAGKGFINELIKEGKLSGLIKTGSDEQALIQKILDMPDEIRSWAESIGATKTGVLGEAVANTARDTGYLSKETPLNQKFAGILTGKASPTESSTFLLNNLIPEEDMSKYFQLKKTIAEKAAQGLPQYKVLDAVLNKAIGRMQDTYQRIDQTFKLTSAIKMTSRGLTESELRTVARNTIGGITEGDITKTIMDAGQKKYLLTWDKATDIANEIHMNYSAMPAFVRMIRAVPIIGAPFGSFSYAMVPKIAKTFVNNPSFFNKAGFLMNELAGTKTPLEKENLKSKYYSWFNSPGMFKLPFTQDHPVYWNLTNYIPYYNMNLFTPSEKKYDATIPGDLMSAIDKIGLFKTPVGSTMWDYLIQPYLIQQGDVPQNQFGQPIYPLNATTGEKIGYAARNLAEAYVPSIAAPLGLPLAAVLPETAGKYIPSYGGRKFFEGAYGKNQLGVLKTAQTPAETELLNTASYLGASLNPMSLTNLTNQVKKTIKKK